MTKSLGPGGRVLIGVALIALGLARHTLVLPLIGAALIVISLATLAARR
jgi:hypothetical protein